MAIFYTLFGLGVAYAVVGNALVLFALTRRNVPIQFLWAGTPGYLYRRCVSEKVGIGLQRFAFSTNVALLIAFLCLPALMLEPT